MAEVSQRIYLGDSEVFALYDNKWSAVNPFFQPEAEPTPVLTDSVMMLDATSATSYPGTGNTWTDLSGNGNNADVSLITPYWNAGGYFDFPGTDYTKVGTVTTAASLDIFDGDFSCIVVGTIDLAKGGVDDACGPYSNDQYFAAPGTAILIVRNSADGNYRKMQFYLNQTVEAGLGLSTGVVFTNIGDWFVIHVVRSGSNVQYYNTANTSIGSFTSSNNANNDRNFIIGRGRNNASTSQRYDGKIACLGFYDKALSADERLENINYFKNKLGF
jgi:hypothetical protein